jgi:hypothetical protein
MKVIPILLVTLIVLIVTKGQNVDLKYVHSSLKEEVRKLQAEGVDTIFVYHSYCTGCETQPNSSENCNDFIEARVVWKKDSKDYAKHIHYDGRKGKVTETSLDAFKFFIKNIKLLTDRRPLPKGQFYPPVPVHHYGEDFYLVINGKWYNTNLREPQRENKDWKKYSWIEPTIKLSDLNKLEVNRK